MHRYIIPILLLLLSGQALAASEPAARIGSRSYTADELEQGWAAYREYKQTPSTLSKADSLALYEQYFNELLAMYIYDAAIKQGMVKVQPLELEVYIKKNPPQGVRQIPDLQSNGRFDQKKYEQALRERPAFKQEVLDFSRDMFSYHKLIEGIRLEAMVNEDSLRQAWLKSGHTADATIIHFDFNRFSDLVASEEEVWALYEELKDSEFKKSNGRSLYFVRFSGTTSRATASLEAQAKALSDSRALYQLALKLGLPEAAKQMGLELQESQMFTESDPFIRGIGREAELINQAFEHPVGSLFEPHQGMMGDILVCEVARSAEDFYEEFRGLEPILRHRATSKKRSDANRVYVQDFIRKHKAESYLEAAERDSIRIVQQNEISLKSSNAPIGEVEALNRAILSTPQGEFTPLIESFGMYYLALVTKRNHKSTIDWEAQKDAVLTKALQEAQDKHLDEWYLSEKAKLDIQLPIALREMAHK